MNKQYTVSAIAMVLLTWALPSQAATPLNGTFKATQICPAYVSFRKETNPHKQFLTNNQQYSVVGINRPNGDWLKLKWENGPRWVAKHCGTLNGNASTLAQKSLNTIDTPTQSNTPTCQQPNTFQSYVLAVSWQPGFCEHNRNANKKPECQAFLKGKLPATHLTLHGLWPNKAQCGISYGDCNPKNKLDLSKETIAKVAPWMPNFYYQTGFGEHEWSKHGTCQSLGDDQYFLTAINMVKTVNDSAIGQYILAHQGKSIDVSDFKAELTKKMGINTVSRLRLVCAQHRYLQEIRLNLPMNAEQDSNWLQNLAKAPKSGRFIGNCRSTIYIDKGSVKKSFWDKF
jgi:ribonuclease T2